MVKLKKGIFYTLAGFFLVSLVLVLSILVTITLSQSNERLKEAGGFERLISLDDSIINLLRNLDDGINIKVEEKIINNSQKTTLTFEENIDEDFINFRSTFLSELQELKNYIESDQSEIQFDLDKIYNSTNKVNLFVKPYNLKYTHIKELSSNRTLINVLAPSSMTDLKVSINLNNFSVITPNLITWVVQNPGLTNILINVTDDSNYSETLNVSIDLDLNNTFLINHLGTTAEINIGKYCLRCISIDGKDFPSINSKFETDIPYLSDSVTVNYPAGTYSMNFSELDIYLNKTPRIV